MLSASPVEQTPPAETLLAAQTASASFSDLPIYSHDTVGLCDNSSSTFYLTYTNQSGYADVSFLYGPGGNAWIPITGDWDGDYIDTPGFYDPRTSFFYLRNSNDTGYANITFQYGVGNAGWVPIAGDWNGDGIDGVGLYDPVASVFYLKNDNNSGYADITFMYGAAACGWTPLAADWNGDRTDTIGLYNPVASVFYLRDTNAGGYADNYFSYGPPGAGWLPIAGNWLGILNQTIGLYDSASSMFYLRDSNSSGYADTTFQYGPAGAGWLPLAGDWDGVSTMIALTDAVESSETVTALSDADLPGIVQTAVENWATAGLEASILRKLDRAEFVVIDLPGNWLGLAQGDTIYLDADAAGHGWFVDPTPALNEEFSNLETGSAKVAVDSIALERIDLLSIVEHELGHLAGYQDLDALAENIMRGSLGVGVRLILD